MGGRVVLMPDCPKTGSPVPWLTSIHAREGRGNYGDANYRGNCSGLLIEDLLRYFQPRRVLDPIGRKRDVRRRVQGARHLVRVARPYAGL